MAAGRAASTRTSRSTRAACWPPNPNPSTDSNRALMHALVDWVVKRRAAAAQPLPAARRAATWWRRRTRPPASRLIPGVPLPDGVLVPLYDYDFGPAFRYADVSGVMAMQPPVVRQVLPQLVPQRGRRRQRDRRRAQRAARGAARHLHRLEPVARGFFKGQIQALGGGYIPFAKTKARAARRRAIRGCRSRSATARTRATWRR